MRTKKKVVLAIFLLALCSFILAVVVVSQLSVICEVDSTIWAIEPRTTVDNVIVYEAVSGNKFSLDGIYTDKKGERWYVVSGVLKYDSNAGLDRGFILKNNCSLSFG